MIHFKKAVCFLSLLGVQIGVANLARAAETAPGITDLSKPFNEYAWVTAHHGYRDDMRSQLERGTRGFRLDLRPGNLTGGSDVYLCDAQDTASCDIRADIKFADALNRVFLPYLRSNADAVVTLLLQSHVDRESLAHAFGRVPGLADMVFDPEVYRNSAGWPTLQQMISQGKRLVILSDNRAGQYEVDGKTINVLEDSQWESQNTWELGENTRKHDWSCLSRWGSYRSTVAASGFVQWPRLFVMNQFHPNGATAEHAGGLDNNLTELERRVDSHCASALGKRTAPNYLAIEFNQAGDGFSYAAALTQGGLYFYEKNDAAPDGDTLCVLAVGHDYDLSLPAQGCGNDEARSMRLRGVKAGTRISIYDSPDGNLKDDHAYIDVKRDIGIDESVVIGTFERNDDNADYKLAYVRNNGLDGKVSRITEGRTPDDFSDGKVVLYEGNGASQSIVCTVSLAPDTRFNFGEGCSNDEARSAKILSARAGTRFSVYGNRDQKEDQGFARVEIVSDITQPVIIDSFERSHDEGSWKIISHADAGQLDGKVSSMDIQLP
ncbi:hypothetical protein [Pseudomonas citri]|uniref:hypothetical protein n=1 Tax=Pseudomonas citri TaxID=2978349 RepID=UPI0021B59E62|nr:hypothetical protein [Pseudomonas citri]